MKYLMALITMFVLISIAAPVSAGWWDSTPSIPVSPSGLIMQNVNLQPVIDGKSMEQYNIARRLVNDNKLDAVRYVYVIGLNGQVVNKFVINGKVTSSGKRLTPTSVAAFGGDSWTDTKGMPITIDGHDYRTNEVLDAEGSYGTSTPYIYMFTTAGNYVQVIPLGTFLMYVADKPLTSTELTFSGASVPA